MRIYEITWNYPFHVTRLEVDPDDPNSVITFIKDMELITKHMAGDVLRILKIEIYKDDDL